MLLAPNPWRSVFRREETVIVSPSGDLKIVARLRLLRLTYEWQIQVRGVLMAEGSGSDDIPGTLLSLANDLDIHNLSYAAGEARILADALS